MKLRLAPLPHALARSDAALASERDEFTRFYREHERMIRGTLFHLVARDELDDLVQAAFVRAWENRAQFEGRARASSWVVRIALNLAQDHYRHRRSRPEDATETEALGRAIQAAAPDWTADASLANREWVARAVATLPHEQREAVVLRYFQDLELEEIAFATGQPLGTVKSRLHHAKAKLKSFFDLEEDSHD